ncbi:MAG: adenylate/guanylate cyclase domain-containing protein, partial [Myxococcales bacterium]|nr:adenylate/guanylate cyclase domain-containing protein [Myxococcales bacterium]
VTVMFTDFSGFTKLSSTMDPAHLVGLIDEYFREFDLIITKHGLEKIKTIGDAYMAAGNLSKQPSDQVLGMLAAAFEIRDLVHGKIMDESRINTFDIRIGLHTGPVTAGVVGLKKFSYDIWGDTVNLAARMEQHSEPGKINISHDIYERIQEHFDCDYRGKIDVKGKGPVDMYFIERKISA